MSLATYAHILAAGKTLHDAFSGYGFVYLLDHGISSQNVSAMFEASRQFFQLPDVEKDSCKRDPILLQGYVRPGGEILDNLKEEEGEKAIHELRETFDVMSLAPKTPFPDKLVPELRSLFHAMGTDLVRLAGRIFEALSISLGLDKDFLGGYHKEMLHGPGKNLSTLRSAYYPAIEGLVAPGLTRCGEHSDHGTITFLFQDDMGGLEVRGVEQEWIQANPLKDAVLVNVGDMMEIFTNGTFPATRHRVVIPREEEVLRRKTRQSFVFFVNPDNDTVIKPIHGEEKPRRKKYGANMTAKAYILSQFGKTYQI